MAKSWTALRFRQAVEGNKGLEAILTAYRNLSMACANPGAEMGLSESYRAWTGVAIPALPDPVVVVGKATAPWGIYIVQSISKKDQAPAHCMPISVIEVAFLDMLSPKEKDACAKDFVDRWVRNQPKLDKQPELVNLLKKAGWEIDDVAAWPRSSADSYWRATPKAPLTGSDEPMPSWVTSNAPVTAGDKGAKKLPSTSTSRHSSGPVPGVSLGENDELPF